jgi:hypothetical protein
LASLIIKNNASAKPMANAKWSRVFDLMMNRDKRTPEMIESVMRFSQSNKFWIPVILSPDNLRKHFDRLTVQMKSEIGDSNDGHKSNDPNW